MQFDTPGEGIPVQQGWVPRVWDPAVQERFQLLIKTLSQKYDGKIFVLISWAARVGRVNCRSIRYLPLKLVGLLGFVPVDQS